jgi:hypothetical protein
MPKKYLKVTPRIVAGDEFLCAGVRYKITEIDDQDIHDAVIIYAYPSLGDDTYERAITIVMPRGVSFECEQ